MKKASETLNSSSPGSDGYGKVRVKEYFDGGVVLGWNF